MFKNMVSKLRDGVSQIVAKAKAAVTSIRNGIQSAFRPMVRSVGYGMQVVGAATGVNLLLGRAHAQTDIASVITTLASYQTGAIAIGIAVLLWVVGRMLVHKFTRG